MRKNTEDCIQRTCQSRQMSDSSSNSRASLQQSAHQYTCAPYTGEKTTVHRMHQQKGPSKPRNHKQGEAVVLELAFTEEISRLSPAVCAPSLGTHGQVLQTPPTVPSKGYRRPELGRHRPAPHTILMTLLGFVPDRRTERSDTANSTVEFGGTSGGFPREPYANSGGTTSSRWPPTFMPSMPVRQHRQVGKTGGSQ